MIKTTYCVLISLKNKICCRLAREIFTSTLRVRLMRCCSGIHIGKDVYLGLHLTLNRFTIGDTLFIGDRVAISPNVTIITSYSPESSELRKYNLEKQKKLLLSMIHG